MATKKFSVPIIDLSNYLPFEKEKLATAVTELGCFRVLNHGIPAVLAAEMKAIARSLTKLPIEIKRQNIHTIPQRGYIANNQHIEMSQFFESFGIYNAASSEDILAFCSQLQISPAHREIISEYASRLHDLIADIACKMSDSLGVIGCSFKDWSSHLRLHHYNYRKEAVGSYGVNLHTDTGYITIIHEDEKVGGYEIIGPKGNFVCIDPVPNTFLVNIGDMAKVWSNGVLHNVKHRVMCREVDERFTIALFLLAPKDDIIKPQKEFIDSKNPRLFSTINYQDYLQLRYSSDSFVGQLLNSSKCLTIMTK